MSRTMSFLHIDVYPYAANELYLEDSNCGYAPDRSHLVELPWLELDLNPPFYSVC